MRRLGEASPIVTVDVISDGLPRRRHSKFTKGQRQIRNAQQTMREFWY